MEEKDLTGFTNDELINELEKRGFIVTLPIQGRAIIPRDRLPQDEVMEA